MYLFLSHPASFSWRLEIVLVFQEEYRLQFQGTTVSKRRFAILGLLPWPCNGRIFYEDFAAIVKPGEEHFIVVADIVRIFPSSIVKLFEFVQELFFRGECGNAVDVKGPVEIFFMEVKTRLDKGLDPFDDSIVNS